MGQSQQNPLQGQLVNFETVRVDDENNISFFKNNSTGQERIVRKWIFNDAKAYAKVLQMHEEREKYVSKNLQKLIKHETVISQDLCTTIYQLYAMWQHHSWSLANEIDQRTHQQRPFTQRQLLNIAANCIEGLEQMQLKNHIHEKLTVHSIKIDQAGNAKIYDPLALPTAENYSVVYRNLAIDRMYLSPEEVASLEMQNLCIKSNKNDVWTFGMILLEAGLLENQSQCYLDECRKINWAKLLEKLKRIEKVYGEKTRNLIVSMLEQNKKVRSSWFQLREHLNQRPMIGSVIKLNEITNLPPRESPQVFAYKSVFHEQSEIYSFSKVNFNPCVQKQNIMVNHVQYPIQSQPVFKENRPVVNFIKPQMGPVVPTFIPIERNFIDRTRYLPPLPQQNQPILSQIRTQPPEMKKFVSSASSQGFLFDQSKSKEQREAIVIESCIQKPKIEQTRHQPLVSGQQKQKPKVYNNDIKNAESITYELDCQNQPFLTHCSSKEIKQLRTEEARDMGNKDISKEVLPMQTESLEDAKSEEDKIQYVIETFQVGSRYEGEKLRNMRHGEGKFFYQDGGMYDGHWQFNKMHGKGLLYYQSGALAYDGFWKNDQFEGRGKLYNESPQPLHTAYNYNNFDNIGECWQYYDGQFNDDMKQGRGKLMLTNGEYFVGNFCQDMIQGTGRFFGRQGTIKGQWQANQLIRID